MWHGEELKVVELYIVNGRYKHALTTSMFSYCVDFPYSQVTSNKNVGHYQFKNILFAKIYFILRQKIDCLVFMHLKAL